MQHLFHRQTTNLKLVTKVFAIINERLHVTAPHQKTETQIKQENCVESEKFLFMAEETSAKNLTEYFMQWKNRAKE